MREERPDPGFEVRYRARLQEGVAYSAGLEGPSIMGRLARLPPHLRDEILAGLSVLDSARLAYHWPVWARPKQAPDLDAVPHRTLFLCAGRGFGKTLSGANRFKQRQEQGARVGAIIGPTLRKMEQYMIEGTDSAPGLLRIYHPSLRPEYLPHKKRIEFKLPPGIGGPKPIAYVHSAEDKDYRGTNTDTVWGDEIGEWPYFEDLWMNIELATRARGPIPTEIIFTSTPVKRRFIRRIVEDPDTVTIFAPSSENTANTDPRWLARMAARMGGTRMGRQELEGEILTDTPDALFRSEKLDADRVVTPPAGLRIVVAVDPGISQETGIDPTGIVVMGEDPQTRHLFILEDLTDDERTSPEVWGRKVVEAYDRHKASAVVVERNRGGDLVASNIRAVMRERRGAAAAASIPIAEVHASRGKVIRAEPVAALHERGMIHVVGVMPALETEITEWSPSQRGPSPNRLDALVWGAYHLGNLSDETTDWKAGFEGYTEAVKRLDPAEPGDQRPHGMTPPSQGIRSLLGVLERGRRGRLL